MQIEPSILNYLVRVFFEADSSVGCRSYVRAVLVMANSLCFRVLSGVI